jgi:EmrB/QacA subfamily drug resistance transporter
VDYPDYLGAHAEVPGRAERARSSRLRRHPNSYWLAVAAVCLGALVSQLDTGMVTVAYPTLHRAFSVPVTSVIWVGLSTLLTVVATLVAFGRRSDVFGRKRVYVDGFVVFTVGACAASLAGSFAVLLAARVVEGVGVAMLQANSVALVAASVPTEKRTTALGFQGASQAAGLALGPLLGGILLAHVSWRWLFVATLPIVALALPAALLFIPRSRDLRPPERLDVAGAVLLGAAAVGIVGSITEGARAGWGALTAVLLIGGGGALVGLFVVERKVSNPLLDPHVLKERRVSAGLITATLTYLAFFGALVATPFYVESLGHSATTAGLVTMALPVGLGLVAPLSGMLRRRTSERVVVPVAFLAVALGLAVASRAGSLVVLALALFGAGVGLGVANTFNNASIMQGVPATDRATASALLNMVRALGTALGLALVTSLLALFGGTHGVSGPRATITALVAVPLLAAAVGAVLFRSEANAAPLRSSKSQDR